VLVDRYSKECELEKRGSCERRNEQSVVATHTFSNVGETAKVTEMEKGMMMSKSKLSQSLSFAVLARPTVLRYATYPTIPILRLLPTLPNRGRGGPSSLAFLGGILNECKFQEELYVLLVSTS